MSLARDLDMADGVLDGKLYGRPIVEVPRSVGYPRSYGSPSYRPEYRPATTYAPSRTAYPLDYPLDDGAYYGRPVSRAAYAPATYRHSPLDAYGLDYAPRVSHASYPSTYRSPAVYDDGYYGAPYGSSYGHPSASYGRRIIGAPTTRVVGSGYDSYNGYPHSGVHGRRVISSHAPPRTYSSYRGAAPVRRYVDEPEPRFKSRTANALDAADGVIDGKFQAKDIVQEFE